MEGPNILVSVVKDPGGGRLRGAAVDAGTVSPIVMIEDQEDAAAAEDARRPVACADALARLAARMRPSVLSYSACQVIMIMVNKALTTVFDFKSVTFLLLSQNVGLGLFLAVLFATGAVRVAVPLRTYVLSIPQCVFYVCYLSTGLYALDHLSVPVYTIMKNTCPVLIAVAESAVRSQQHTPPVVISLFTILVGVYVGQDATGSWASSVGVLWMLLHMYFNVCYVVYTREFVARCAPSRLQSMTFTFVTSLPLYAALVTAFNEWDSAQDQIRALVHTHGWAFILTFASSVVCGVTLTFSIFWVCQQSSALTLSVIGSFNKIPIVGCAMLVFGASLSARNCVGLVAVLCGSIAYAYTVHKYPPTPLTSTWSRTNVAMLGAVVLFLSVTITQVVRTLPPHVGCDKAPPVGVRPPVPQSTAPGTLAVLFPGAASVSVVDFVTRYLPAVAAAVRRGLKTKGKSRRLGIGVKGPGLSLPQRDDSLRLGTAAPVLVLNASDSPLLHPNLLPFLGGIFSEILVDVPGSALLRVVRLPRELRGKLVAEGHNETDETWDVLALSPASHADGSPGRYVAIDASTAVCSTIVPTSIGAMASELCPAGRRHKGGVRLAAPKGAGSVTAVGDFSSVVHPPLLPADEGAVWVWRRGRWSRPRQAVAPNRQRGRWDQGLHAARPQQQRVLRWQHRCTVALRGPTRGLLPAYNASVPLSKRRKERPKPALPGLVRVWHREHADLERGALPAMECPRDTTDEADVLGAGGHAGALLQKGAGSARGRAELPPIESGRPERPCPGVPGQDDDEDNMVLFTIIAATSCVGTLVARGLARRSARR